MPAFDKSDTKIRYRNRYHKELKENSVLPIKIIIGNLFAFYMLIVLGREIIFDRGLITPILTIFTTAITGLISARIIALKTEPFKVIPFFMLAAIIGRIFTIYPDVTSDYPVYHIGMILLGFTAPSLVYLWLSAAGEFGKISPEKEEKTARSVSYGILGAVIFDWALRTLGISEDIAFVSIYGTLFTIFITLIARNEIREGLPQIENTCIEIRKDYPTGIIFIAALSMISLIIFILLPLGYPELYGYMTGGTSASAELLFIIGFIIGALLVEKFGYTDVRLKAVASVGIILTGSVEFYPSPSFYYGSVLILSGFGVLYVLTWVLTVLINRGKNLPRNLIFPLMLGYILFRFITVERYMPYLVLLLGVPLPIFAISHIIYNKRIRQIPDINGVNGRNTNKRNIKGYTNISVVFFLILAFIGAGCTGIFGTNYTAPNEKTVWASLYTWYGVPGETAGKYGYDEWQKNASLPEAASDPSRYFGYNLSVASDITYGIKDNMFTVSGILNGSGDRLVLDFDIKRMAYTRMYVTIEIGVKGPADPEIEMGIYYTRHMEESTVYYGCRVNESIEINTTKTINRVFNIALNSTPINGNDYPGHKFTVVLKAKVPGNYSLGIAYMEGSSWKHYNEDFHTYSDEEGFYYNDPPVHIATAHRVFYDGKKWPEIPVYGIYNHSKWNELPPNVSPIFYGIYDSLNRTVIKAQLMLMEKAGIDVCQIMHPWSIDVARLILEVAAEINSNLSFTYYTGKELGIVKDIMDNLADNPRYYKIDGRPVITWGYTGGLDEPFSVVYRRVCELRRMYNVILVGDLYSSRYITREEMLQIYDIWYYYDTSAFLRHGYALPGIKNYQPDGKLIPFNNWGNLDKRFGSLAALAHAHGKMYCAIVIPGTDNTAVHGFYGSPMYDGRTGTINSRSDGLTYNYTWESAIKSGADFVNIVSWNELHEGTEIEPTVENGTYYVELTSYWSSLFKGS